MSKKERKPQLGYRVESLLVCDDVRYEKSGKLILIGVYNRAIIVSEFPAILPKLFFFFSLTFQDVSYEKFTFQLVDSNGNEMMSFQDNLPFVGLDQNTNLTMQAMQLTFSEETTIDIRLGVDHAPETISKFHIRGPNTNEEKALIAAQTANSKDVN